MIKINKITDSFRTGAAAEELAAAHIAAAGWQLVDVRSIRYYQIRDIDYILCSSDGAQQYTMDIKTDKCYGTGNYAIEITSNVERNTLGWVYTSKADYICIIYPVSADTYEYHIINLPILRQWLTDNISNCRKITNSTRAAHGDKVLYHSKFVLINRKMLQTGSTAVEEIKQIKEENAA